jgi:transcriptional regulator with XRE-family HTH domain
VSAQQIRAARESVGVSLYDVPRRMPVSTVRWAMIEAGIATPTAAELDDFERHVLRRR